MQMEKSTTVEAEQQADKSHKQKDYALLKAVARAQGHIISNDEPQRLFADLLNDFLKLTNSEYGNIGEVICKPNGDLYLKSHACSDIAWDETTEQLFQESLESGMEFHELKSLYGAVMLSGETVISNDPANDPRRCGLPEGHPGLKSYLGIPVFDDDKLIAMIGVANRPSGYDKQLVEYLQPLINIYGKIIGKYKAEQEHKVRKELAQFRAALDYTVDNVLLIDPESSLFVDCNRSALQRMGYTKDELLQIGPCDIMPELTQETVQNVVTKVVSGEEEFIEYSTVHQCKDGSLFPVEVRLSKVGIEDDKPLLIAMVRDITERKNNEEELMKYREHLEELVDERTSELKRVNSELEAYSYSISHDLRAPLRSIDGFSYALLEDYSHLLDETAKDYIQRVRHAAQHMGRLIDDMLQLSQVARVTMKYKEIDLSVLAEQIITMLYEKEPKREITVEIHPGLKISGDEGQVYILLQNLLSNAWKYTRKTPQATLEFGSQQLGEDEVFFVKDNGIGFDMTYADKIFDAFQRLHAKDQYSGTGIGLATVKRVVDRHGGSIWVESEPGRGATFYFVFG
jgi:hypothetical protein